MLNATGSPYKTSVRKVTSTNNKNIQAMKNKINREKTFTVITILCAVIIIGAIVYAFTRQSDILKILFIMQ